MMSIMTTTHLTSFPMGWEFCSIAVAVVLIWSMVFCADCLGRWSASRSDTSSQGSTDISYDITAPDTVDLNEYDILNHEDVVLNNEHDILNNEHDILNREDVILNNERDVLRNDNVPNYASNAAVGHQPYPRRSQPIPIPPRYKEPADKHSFVPYNSNPATACADDIYRRENIVTPITSEDSAIEIPSS